MDAGQSLLVIVAIEFDMLGVLRSKFTHHIIDIFHATNAFTHCQRREVSVAAGTIPFFKELGGEGDGHVEVLGNALKNVARDPEMVAHCDTFNGTNLVFPLSRHDFSVCS